MRATWLADVLRGAGLTVVELDGWQRRGRDFDTLRAVVWHHDGSPPGASPGVPAYMARQIDQGKAGAQCWVGLDGTWHLVAAGRVGHAGRVLPGKPGNRDSLGIETDHTTGEPWSGLVLLDSLRRGTAAILRKIGYAPHPGLEFHKTICSPPGRKNDPDGLDLTTERREVAHLFLPSTFQGDLLMAVAKDDNDARLALIGEWYVSHLGRVPAEEETALHLWVFARDGAYRCWRGIADSPEARQRRKAA